MSKGLLPVPTVPQEPACTKSPFATLRLASLRVTNPLAAECDSTSTARCGCFVLTAGVLAYAHCKHGQRPRRCIPGRQQAHVATRLLALGRMSSDLNKAFGVSDDEQREHEAMLQLQLEEELTSEGREPENWFAAATSGAGDTGDAVDVWTAAGAASRRQDAESRKEKAKQRFRRDLAQQRDEEVEEVESHEVKDDCRVSRPHGAYRLMKLLRVALASDDCAELSDFLEEDEQQLLAQNEVSTDCHPVAEALSVLAQRISVEELHEHGDLLVASLPKLSVADIMNASLWNSAWTRTIHNQLVLIDAVSGRGGAQAWRACGVKLSEVATACVEFAQQQDDGEGASAIGSDGATSGSRQDRWGRRPQARYAKYAQWHNRRTTPRLEDSLSAQGSSVELAQHSLEEAEIGRARVSRILQHLASTDALSSLSGKEAAMLFRTVGGSLGPAIQHILHPILRDIARNQRYDDDTLMALSMSLPDAIGRTAWPKLSGAVLSYWQTLWPDTLFDRLLGTPETLHSAPSGFQTAFATEVTKPRHGKVFARVTPAQLEELLLLWSSRGSHSFTTTACAIIEAVVGKHLHSLSAAQLIAVTKTLAEADSLPRKVLLQWWQGWSTEIVSGAAIMGCGRCLEALREVAAWSKQTEAEEAEATAQSLADEVLDDILCTALQKQMKKEAFTPALLLEMYMVAVQRSKQSVLSEDIAAELEVRLKHSAASHGGEALPLVMSLKIVSGETPLPCAANTPLWRALVSSIASRLHNERGLDMFKRYRPDRSLIVEVMSQLKEGDRHRLELAWLLQRE